jgi:hypothetical protein
MTEAAFKQVPALTFARSRHAELTRSLEDRNIFTRPEIVDGPNCQRYI